MTRRVKILEILDDTQILFGGVVEEGDHAGDRVSFSVPPEQGGRQLAEKFREPNTVVYAELPDREERL